MTVRIAECIYLRVIFTTAERRGWIEFGARVTLAEVSRHVIAVNTLSSWIYPGYSSSLLLYVTWIFICGSERESYIIVHEHFIFPLAEAALSHYFIIRICNSNEESADENCLTEKFVRLVSIDKRFALYLHPNHRLTKQKLKRHIFAIAKFIKLYVCNNLYIYIN